MPVMSTIIKKFLGIEINFLKFFKSWHFKSLIISAEMGETKIFFLEVTKMDQISCEGSIFAYFIYGNRENYMQNFYEPFEVRRF